MNANYNPADLTSVLIRQGLIHNRSVSTGQCIRPLQTLHNPTLERPALSSFRARWSNPDRRTTTLHLPTNHVLDWEHEILKKHDGSPRDENGNAVYAFGRIKIKILNNILLVNLCRFPEVPFEPDDDTLTQKRNFLHSQGRLDEYRGRHNPLEGMLPRMNGQAMELPWYVRYGRRADQTVNVPYEEGDNSCELDNSQGTTAAISSNLDVETESSKSTTALASSKAPKMKKILIMNRSFRLADHRLLCPWCMTDFESSKKNAEKHMRNFHRHKIRVQRDAPSIPRPSPTMQKKQPAPQAEQDWSKRYICPWPFDNECGLQARNGTLTSIEEMIQHMVSHIGVPFFCHLCGEFMWEKSEALKHPSFCRTLGNEATRVEAENQLEQCEN
ncbi:hypothetical protein BDY19DRAFT_996715 [Irpex rosettiformis]|uniref:Uncharacterized protein n=1 Tax=Irpex rosettiformis TaxID=378272 RepID=A0ACB8TU49_9APHY|nr:hypothetical protein BDY19DRAFT_996715 [Irpex rosettiformis]